MDSLSGASAPGESMEDKVVNILQMEGDDDTEDLDIAQYQ